MLSLLKLTVYLLKSMMAPKAVMKGLEIKIRKAPGVSVKASLYSSNADREQLLLLADIWLEVSLLELSLKGSGPLSAAHGPGTAGVQDGKTRLVFSL